MPKKPRISIVVAMGRDRKHNRVIGKTNELLWPIPDDLRRFKQLTLGHPVIMGRKTFQSIVGRLGKPLPDRTNVVISRDKHWSHKGALIAHSLEEAIKKASDIDSEEIFIGGGSQIYEQALPLVDRLYLTLIDDEKEGDSYFPPYESLFTRMIRHEHREHEGLRYTWVDFER